MENEVKNISAGISNITLLPFQNQSMMPVVYRLGDIFVLPSQGPGETWGLAINEAMACGSVVVASNKCGGAIDLIKQGENGYIIEPKSNVLVGVLKNIQANQAFIKNGSKASINHIQSFSYSQIAESIEKEIYRSNFKIHNS